MFSFNSKLLKKIEEQKNNYLRMHQELKEELDAIKKDFNLFDDKISKFKANNYVKSPEIVNIIRSEIFESAKKLPKIRSISVNKPVATENTDKYKNLPTFISSVDFANILDINKNEFWNRKKQIHKKVRCYNFGQQTYRYYKKDVLNFIKHQNTEDDIFILLENSKDDCISRQDLISFLNISEAAFYRKKKRIQKIIPPIDGFKNPVFYKNADILTFLKRGGLSGR